MDDVTALIAKLHDPDGGVRRNAVVALGKIGSPAVSALIDALQDTDLDVRWMAATALGKVNVIGAIPALSVALQDTDPGVRRAVAKALGAMNDPQVVPILIDALQDWEVLGTAATTLGEIRDPRAIPALIAAFEASESEIHSKPAPPLEFDPVILPNVTEYRIVSNKKVSIVRALGKFQDYRIIPTLITAFQSNDSHLTAHATLALSRLGSDAVPALIEALPSRNAGARRDIVELLGKIGDSNAVTALVEILGSVGDKIEASQKVPWNLLVSTAMALSQIAVSDPTPVLRSALPSLRRLQKRDPAFQEALTMIEAATSGMKDLPLPANAPLPDTSSLPRSADAPDLLPDALPIPSASAADAAESPRLSAEGWWKRLRRVLLGA